MNIYNIAVFVNKQLCIRRTQLLLSGLYGYTHTKAMREKSPFSTYFIICFCIEGATFQNLKIRESCL